LRTADRVRKKAIGPEKAMATERAITTADNFSVRSLMAMLAQEA